MNWAGALLDRPPAFHWLGVNIASGASAT